MYLFSRSARLAPGRTTEAMSWALNVTEKVNQISEVPVNLWMRVFSPGVGTLAWTAVLEDLSVLEATNDKLMADSGYLELVDKGAAFASGDSVDDQVVSLVVADRPAEGQPRNYVVVVEAVLAAGGMTKGIELGVEIAQRVKAITSAQCSFGVGVTGDYGAVGWFTGYDSIQDVDRAQQALQADTEFTKLIDDKASKVYAEGRAVQTLYRKLA